MLTHPLQKPRRRNLDHATPQDNNELILPKAAGFVTCYQWRAWL